MRPVVVQGIRLFFMEKGKANEHVVHQMVSNHHRPQPRVTPEELQVRCRPLRCASYVDLETLPQVGHTTVAWRV